MVGNSDVVFNRNNVEAMRFNSNGNAQFNGQWSMDSSNNLICRYSSDSNLNVFDFRNNYLTDAVIRFMCSSNIILTIWNDQIRCSRDLEINNTYKLKTNEIDSNGNSDVVFKRNDVEIMKFNSSNEAEFTGNIRIANQNNQFIEFPNCRIREGTAVDIDYFDFINSNTSGHFRYYLGQIQSSDLKMSITPTQINLYNQIISWENIKIDDTKALETNEIDSNGNNDVVFKRNGSEVMRFNSSLDIVVSGSISVPDTKYLYASDIRHNTGTDLSLWSLSTISFYSNAVKQMEIKTDRVDINDDISMPPDKGITTGEIFTHNYDTSGVGDVAFQHNNVDYMAYRHTDNKILLKTDVISNYDISCVNLIESSDKRLKESVEDVELDCSELVKTLKVKTYNLINDKDEEKRSYIGFIADEVEEILPKKIKAIVSNKGEYKGINYSKLSCILFKALQETITKNEVLEKKVEHLEASMYEMMEMIKELKGKGEKPKPKAKAKPKSKVKSDDED